MDSIKLKSGFRFVKGDMTVEEAARACAKAAGALADPDPKMRPVSRTPEVGKCFKVTEYSTLLFIRTLGGVVWLSPDGSMYFTEDGKRRTWHA